MERFELASLVGDKVTLITTSKVYLISITDSGSLFAETCPRPLPQAQPPQTPPVTVAPVVAAPDAHSEPVNAPSEGSNGSSNS